MLDVGSGRNYRIVVDTSKNRLYLLCSGDFMRAEDNPHIVEHADQACRRLNPGFTMVSDFLEMKTFGLPDVAQRVQAILMSAGVSKIATVWGSDSFSKLIVDSSAQKMGETYAERRRSFPSRAEAETWLDE